MHGALAGLVILAQLSICLSARSLPIGALAFVGLAVWFVGLVAIESLARENYNDGGLKTLRKFEWFAPIILIVGMLVAQLSVEMLQAAGNRRMMENVKRVQSR